MTNGQTEAARSAKHRLQFTVPGIPVAQPRQRHASRVVNGKVMPRNYIPDSHGVHAYKAAVQRAAADAMAGASPIEGPVGLALWFFLPRPKSRTRRRGNVTELCATGKDIDNLAKAVMDVCNGILWHDDRQVALLIAKKFTCGDGDCVQTVVTVSPEGGEVQP